MSDAFEVGFRFRRWDARTLRQLAERAKVRDLHEATALFDRAAIAAEVGEPLIVKATSAEEAIALAQGFSAYGVEPPIIEDFKNRIRV